MKQRYMGYEKLFGYIILLQTVCSRGIVKVYRTIKKTLKIFGPRTWCEKKPFGHRIAHHGYLLMSCPGQYINKFFV